MIRAVFFRDNGRLTGFALSGHAGWGESGSDAACAAVSSAAQLTCNTVTDFFRDRAQVSAGENSLELRTDKDCGDCSVKLIESFHTHLGFILEEFPGCLKISYKD